MIGLDLRELASGSDRGSLSNRLRDRRFAIFERAVSALERPFKILDLGGTNQFWENRGWAGRDGVHVVIANLDLEERRHGNIEPVVADATDLRMFANRSFDLVFSNSVIEHLRTFDAQQAMASEIRRLSCRYWVQTPNYWFPIEPHFLFPGWQWLPQDLRVAIIRRRRIGWRGPVPELAQAREAVSEIRLLRRHELRHLFPDACIKAERFCGLVKSWIAVEGLRVDG